jgi:hypothetical protein
MKKDTACLIWLLSPFTAFKQEDTEMTSSSNWRIPIDDPDDAESALRKEVAQLAHEFQGIFGVESIDRLAHECLEIVMTTGARHYLG